MLKNILFIISFLTVSNLVFSQNIQGKAIYRTASAIEVSFSLTTEAEDSSMANKPEVTMSSNEQEEINRQIRASMQKEYELIFSNSESIYKEISKLKDVNEERGIEVIGIGKGTEGGIYKDTKRKIYIENRDVFGKLFLITDTLEKIEWNLINENRSVGEYICYKAEGIKTSYKQGELVTTSIIAWYTLDVPISQGPAEYWGLPGFILELSDGNLQYVCSSIFISNSDTDSEDLKVEVPLKGKKVGRNEFKKIYREKVLEMAERYGSKRKKKKN